jgi:RsiW-degrading membrane proteinase PrsW (M82 family)
LSNDAKRDLPRQVATVVGALFQVLAGAVVPIGAIAKETPSLVIPTDYAFAIWGPIFVLCLAYTAYQALPANRQNPLLRRVGWYFAGAFFLNGLWEVFVPLRQPILLQLILVGIFACLAISYLRLVGFERGVLNRADRWFVALPLGLLFGWITAANAVSFNDTLVELELPVVCC